MAIGDRIGLPDDVSVGYVIGIIWESCNGYSGFLESWITSKIINDVLYFAEHLLKIQLTRVEQFHSHLEPMRLIKKDLFNEQVIKNTYMYLDNNINVNYFLFLTI